MGSLCAHLARRDPPSPERIAEGLHASPHRGDDRTIEVLGCCAIGVSTGDGPIQDGWLHQDDDLLVGVIGAIDNLDELTRIVGSDGRTADPAAIVADLFRREGVAAPARIRGVFAGAISDGERLWAFRDHLGFRSLFHHADPRGVTVASEAKQVVVGAGIAREPDLEALEHIYFGILTDDTPSAVKGVSRLPKSSILHADASRTRLGRYWHPERLLETGRYGKDELQERFDALMAQASSRTLIGPDAVSLSGGIDSPAIAAYAAPAHMERFGEPLAALSAVFPGMETVDESEYIEAVVKDLGLTWYTYERSAPTLMEIETWVDRFDGPVPVLVWPDAVSHFMTARERGIRNLQNGAIAELVMDMDRYLLAHLVRSGRPSAAIREIRRQRRRGAGLRPLVKQSLSGFAPGWSHRAYLRRFPPDRGGRVPAWVDTTMVNERTVQAAVAGKELWRTTQLGGFIGPGLSMEATEVIEHVCGARLRHPWADVDLWEFFLSIPAQDKFPDPSITKSLVRELLRGRVPDVILDRTDKTVFNESLTSRTDYETLRRYLVDPPERIGGVDYELLRERLDAGDMNVFEYIWAKDLACTHAFLDLFR